MTPTLKSLSPSFKGDRAKARGGRLASCLLNRQRDGGTLPASYKPSRNPKPNARYPSITCHYNRHRDKAKRKRLRNNMPKAEIILWAKLRRQQIEGARFRRQYSVGRFVLDFYCPKLKLAIEVDGPSHNGSEAEAYDRFRQQDIESLHIQFLRFRNAEVYQHLEAVVGAIRQKVVTLQKEE